MLRRALVIAGLLLLPSSALALESAVWDFRDGKIPGEWQVRGLGAAEPTAQGVHIRAQNDGYMVRPLDFGRPVHAVRLIAQTLQPTDGQMLWHVPGTPADELVLLPFTLQPGIVNVVDQDLTLYRQWDARADLFGVAFPKGADVTVETITFITVGPLEKLRAAWQTFWAFDTFNASSINFLWGPIVRFIPAEPEAIFGMPPPRGWSANRLFYAALALAGAGAYGWDRWRRKRDPAAGRRVLLAFAAFSMGLWGFYDARMGLEQLQYARTDLHTYLSREPGERMFRGFGNLYDAVLQSVPVLQRDPVFAVLLTPGSPYRNRLQYFAYPSVPVEPSSDTGALKTWFVYGRPDVSVDEEGTLRGADGTVYARGGSILRQFDESSFLYRLP